MRGPLLFRVRRGKRHDRIDDLLVAGAAAERARNRFADFLARRHAPGCSSRKDFAVKIIPGMQ